MVFPSKVILEEFKTLLIKMVQEFDTNDNAKVNYEFLCDADTVLGLNCVIPMLEVVQGLNKYAQN
jgi:hypothetical protein